MTRKRITKNELYYNRDIDILHLGTNLRREKLLVGIRCARSDYVTVRVCFLSLHPSFRLLGLAGYSCVINVKNIFLF